MNNQQNKGKKLVQVVIEDRIVELETELKHWRLQLKKLGSESKSERMDQK